MRSIGASSLAAVSRASAHLPCVAQALWDALINKKDGVIEIPSERWEVDDYYSADQEASQCQHSRN
eukprot:4346522-Amphidinium_carterae.1